MRLLPILLFCSWALAPLLSRGAAPILEDAPSDGKIVRQSNYQLPPFEKSGFLQRPDVREYYEHTIRPEFRAMNRITRIREIFYLSDGLKIKGYILTPRNHEGTLPILVFNHGGNRDFGKLTIHDLLWLHRFTQRGYLVVASQYRGVDGSEGHDEFGGSDVNDVRNIAELAKKLPDADPTRLYILGHSRGGMMTYLSLKDSQSFKAAAVLAGECDLLRGLQDWPSFERDVYEQIIPNYATEKNLQLRNRSACSWPEKITTPVFLLQGDADRNVSVIQAHMMADALTKVHTPVQLEIFPGGDHGLFFRESQASQIVDQLHEWFQKHP